MKAIFTIFALTSLSLFSCFHKVNADETSQRQGASSKRAITGQWRTSEVWSSYDSGDSRKAIFRREDQLKDGFWNVKTDIDANGNGYIEGVQSCQGPGVATSGPARISDFRALNVLGGIFGLLSLLKDAKEMAECVKSPTGGISSLVLVHGQKNFLNQDMNSVSKNLGVFGEKVDTHAVDNECKQLKGVRFVTIANASACVGFSDATNNKIRFLIVQPGEIYAIRVNMRRE